MGGSIERRTGVQRRQTGSSPRFPLVDSGGEAVLRDRRLMWDRRFTGIRFRWLERKLDGFKNNR